MKVLILEPEEDYRNNYAVYVKELGHEAVTSDNKSYLDVYWEVVETCDVIVIDLLVKGGGLACLKILSEKGWKKPVLLQHTTRWYGELRFIDLKRISKTYPFVTFKKKQWDGANMIWFLERFIP